MAISTTPVFPITDATSPWLWRGIDWQIVMTPEHMTERQRTVTSREARTARWPHPLWHYKLKWTVLEDDPSQPRNAALAYPADELQTLVDFILLVRGGFRPFFLNVPHDQAVLAQVIMSATPAGNTDYEMLRAFKPGGVPTPVGGVNEDAPFAVRVNGATVIAQLNTPLDGWIRLDLPPPEGSVLDADFGYYHKVTLAKDVADFEAIQYNLWQLATALEFVTAPP